MTGALSSPPPLSRYRRDERMTSSISPPTFYGHRQSLGNQENSDPSESFPKSRKKRKRKKAKPNETLSAIIAPVRPVDVQPTDGLPDNPAGMVCAGIDECHDFTLATRYSC